MTNPLSDYFQGVSAKRLSIVEIEPKKSNQHEFQGISKSRTLFGTEKSTFPVKFIYLTDEDDKVLTAESDITWYDVRENKPHRSPEYRIYYRPNEIISSAQVNDLLVIGKSVEGKYVFVIAQQGSTSEKQLLWLFGLEEVDQNIVKDFSKDKRDIGFIGRYILSSLGIEQKETIPDFLEDLIKRYGSSFPSTKEFSEYSRSTIKDLSPLEDPDATLMAWLEREELLFKTLERVIVKEQLKKGFGDDGTDVEEFIKLSLSIQNRRKSRAGFSFENNLSTLFSLNEVMYSHGSITERNNRPDFIFPGTTQYHDPNFDIMLLSMLGVKTSAKDRWRQVLSEASKVPNKHLITLEPAISKNQTEEMKAHNLQLVIPKAIFPTYTETQQKELITVKDFIEMTLRKQKIYFHGL